MRKSCLTLLLSLAFFVTVTRAQTYDECMEYDKSTLIGDQIGEFVENYDEILKFSTGYMRAFAFTICTNDEGRMIAMNFTIKEQGSDRNTTLAPLGPIEKGTCIRKKIGDFENLIDKIQVWHAEGRGIYQIRFNVKELGETFGSYPDDIADEIQETVITFT